MSQQETVEKSAPEATGSATSPPAPSKHEEPTAKPPSGHWVLVGGISVAIMLIGAFVAATLPRRQREKELNAAASQAASSLPRVSVVTARAAPATSQHVLPGSA